MEVSKFLRDDPKVSSIKLDFKKKGTVEEIREIAVKAFFDAVIPYYNFLHKEVNPGVWNLLVEPLKNANFYGSNGVDDIRFEIMLSKNGVVATYNDGGTYFRREEVKQCWENRTKHPEKHDRVDKQLGAGLGMTIIYSVADFIFIDTTKGTLYLGLSINNKLFK